LILKGGRSQEGAKSTASHTASMAVSDALFDSALRQAGVLRMYSIDEFVYTLRGFLNMPLPTGPAMAFVTYSGAQGIMSIDTAMEEGLEIARFGEATQERIARVIATASKMKNPIDIYPDMTVHGFEKTSLEILHALMEDEKVHGIVFISSLPVANAKSGAQAFQPIIDAFKGHCKKPLFFSILAMRPEFQLGRAFLEENGFPCYEFPEMAVRVFSKMWQYSRNRKQ
jgi:acyl-CoA synthetase (NDP forming)